MGQILLILIFLGVLVTLVVLFILKRTESSGEIKNSLENFEKNLARTETLLRDEFGRSREELSRNFKDSREELGGTLEKLRSSVEERLRDIQRDNSEKLEKVRATVDEKLQDTLQKRLSESFRFVQEMLGQVQKGLGEMQTLATGVGDLKKVLSNVKARGILGERQLENILEQLLSPQQYEKNVATKKGSREVVEFAVCLPGRDDSGGVVYLPIDSKFPIEDYQALLDAYENGNPLLVEEAGKVFEGTLKRCARDIRDKYLDPPHTTDFGILFLPVEGLYAEALRRKGLMEILQRDLRVTITGPTTLWAFLTSLQMGFRTLAIEKRSGEVWRVLGAVRTEFEKFGTVLKKAQERINLASRDLDDLVGVRTKQIQRKLREVQQLPVKEAAQLLEETIIESEDSSEMVSDTTAPETRI